jgi:arylsulfatase A-like enzyme
MSRPNILYVFTDQQSAGMMSCAGNPWLQTPAMDRLAERGVRFDRAYCTNPVCLPSRFSMITGQMPSYAGIRSNDWQQETPGIPPPVFQHGLGRVFKDAGYDAYYGGKTHLPGFEPDRLGFDILTYDERDQLAQSCADFIRQHDGSKPYLLYVSLINPHDICFMAINDGHDPMLSFDMEQAMKYFNLNREQIEIFMAGPQLLATILQNGDMLDTDQLPPLPPNHQPQGDEPEAIGLMLDQRPFRRNARENYDERRWRLHRWAYCRLTELVDRQLGVILDALEQSGQADNTVIIFTSDHGDHDSAHKLEHKDAPYEEACRIPLIIAEPSSLRAAGHNCYNTVDTTSLISNGLDLIPTLCDYAGITHPDQNLPGHSIRPLAAGQTPVISRDALPVESEFGRAVVTESHKYVEYFSGTSHEQLYDLFRDPGETRNCIHDSDQQAVLAVMQAHFRKLYFAANVQTESN